MVIAKKRATATRKKSAAARMRLTISLERRDYEALAHLKDRHKPPLSLQYVINYAIQRLLEDAKDPQLALKMGDPKPRARAQVQQIETRTLDGRALGVRLRVFRESRGLSRNDLARTLGVRPVTLDRWEAGATKPSPLAAARLHAHGFERLGDEHTTVVSTPVLRRHVESGADRTDVARSLRAGATMRLTLSGKDLDVLPMPWVRNGPPDQGAFHRTLLRLQGDMTAKFDPATRARRLSLVESVAGSGTTAQFDIERPRPIAMSWNSNYGPHGWHRYVGRFPPHLVRALLNHFDAGPKDLVCDPFIGSGTTAVECRLLGIPFVGTEICPLSCLMARTKAAFPTDPKILHATSVAYEEFFRARWSEFAKHRAVSTMSHAAILARPGNPVPTFANVERWLSPEALLGVSITVEFALTRKGFARDAMLLALSSRMRSIGNVDVDVVRAEYSKVPRTNVDVCRMTVALLKKMAKDIDAVMRTHGTLLGPASSIDVREQSVLAADLPERSISHVITSPPYGIEAISYLRTHLLSYRCLVAELKHDPYERRDQTIGSEYVAPVDARSEFRADAASPTLRTFFRDAGTTGDRKQDARTLAMKQFFDDMLSVAERLSL
jgi:transcriptional regulator with XRE-family HTH domain